MGMIVELTNHFSEMSAEYEVERIDVNRYAKRTSINLCTAILMDFQRKEAETGDRKHETVLRVLRGVRGSSGGSLLRHDGKGFDHESGKA